MISGLRFFVGTHPTPAVKPRHPNVHLIEAQIPGIFQFFCKKIIRMAGNKSPKKSTFLTLPLWSLHFDAWTALSGNPSAFCWRSFRSEIQKWWGIEMVGGKNSWRCQVVVAAGIAQSPASLKSVESHTLPETNIAPENRPLEKEIPIGNHHF